MKQYINEDLCIKCGGQCCKSVPGCMMPEDIKGNMLIKLVKIFKSKKYIPEYGYVTVGKGKNKREELVFFIRPITKTETFSLQPLESFGGECIFLTLKGCKLKYENRPSGCKLLEPRKRGCKVHGANKNEA